MPYTTIVIAAIVPALMHYIAVLSIVHFSAKRLGLAGYAPEMLPNFIHVWKEGWPTVLPLVALIYVLFSGYTPYMAAFIGISMCVIVGFTTLRKPVTMVLPILFLAFIAMKYLEGTFSPLLTTVLVACTTIGFLNRRERHRSRTCWPAYMSECNTRSPSALPLQLLESLLA